ncbi:MAG: nucleoside deaminase [Pseudoflavonifractor sp.]
MDREDYMRAALALAREAMAAGEVPVGCVIVQGGKIIGSGRNRREEDRDALGHAELAAIHSACAALGDWRLSDAALYVTLEPCPMCTGAIINARIPRVYYGARDRQAGACGGVLNLFEEGFSHRPRLYGGILEAECSALLQEFFGGLR